MRRLEERPRGPAAGQVNRLERRARSEGAVIVLVLRRGEESGRVVVIGTVLPSDHEEDRVTLDQRVGQERLTLQGGQVALRGLRYTAGGRRQARVQRIQTTQELRPAGILRAEGGLQIPDGVPQRIWCGRGRGQPAQQDQGQREKQGVSSQTKRRP